MKKLLGILSISLLLTGAAVGCSSDDSDPAASGGSAGSSGGGGSAGSTGGSFDSAEGAKVVANYAAIVHANYKESLDLATKLKDACKTLTDNPSQATLEAARKAWLDSRLVYGQSEVFRFYGGPIDGTDGPEGQINGWPLDENHIDYTSDMPTAGIINDAAKYPTITKELLVSENEQGGNEKLLTAGYHAIEFLLWGQDPDNEAGAGKRPFTDFVTGAMGTPAGTTTQVRRAQYLNVAAELLVDDLTKITDAWAPGGDNFGKTFAASDPKEAIGKMLTGIGTMAGAELASERINAAYKEKDDEEEHSCFSDNTNVDILANFLGVQNVYLGKYGSVSGTSVSGLVKAADAELDGKIVAQFTKTKTDIDAMAAIGPFDELIKGEDSAPGRSAVAKVVADLGELTTLLEQAAGKLGVTITTTLE